MTDNTVANNSQYSGQRHTIQWPTTDNTVAKRQTIQWPKEKHQMDKERTTKHFRKKLKIEPRLKLKVTSAVPQDYVVPIPHAVPILLLTSRTCLFYNMDTTSEVCQVITYSMKTYSLKHLIKFKGSIRLARCSIVSIR